METETNPTAHGQVQCTGCGAWFRGIRGLRSHSSGKFVSMACKPNLQPSLVKQVAR